MPFSAQMANSIANDGDALFPALALAPRAAVLGNALFSAVPAVLIIGYTAGSSCSNSRMLRFGQALPPLPANLYLCAH